ncbi:DUF6876 family protein [Pedobacter jeongneungensis]|uniref:DUF6876 family protein n=1 Tax=Pedobacter jeongneungensis TaxID=947309 RepID=UPI000469B6A4|nr:DUF6876 family protein [Pedobacter jeongneungensis]
MLQTSINLNKEFASFVTQYKKGDTQYYIPTFRQYFYTQGIRDIMQNYELYDLLEIVFPFLETNPLVSPYPIQVNVSRVPDHALNYCVVITDHNDTILYQKRFLMHVREFDSLELILSINRLSLPEEIGHLKTSQTIYQ